MIEIILAVLEQGFRRSDILIVTNSPDDYAYLGTKLTEDQVKGKGPLGGLQAALSYATTPYIFLLGCDMPFIRWDVIAYMIAELKDSDVLVPCIAGKMEPLHAIYAKRCLSKLDYYLQNSNPRLNCFFSEVRVDYIDELVFQSFDAELKFFSNINNREELALAEKIYSGN